MPTQAEIIKKLTELSEPFKRQNTRVSGRDCAYILAYHQFPSGSFNVIEVWDQRVPNSIKGRFKGFQTDKLQDTQIIRDRLLQFGFLSSEDRRNFTLTEKANKLVAILEHQDYISGAEAL